MKLNEGQVAVVTGGGSGIGLALAERFADAGLKLMLADVQEDALAEAATLIAGRGVEVDTMKVDVSKETEVQALAQATIDRFGGVHVVCNNAGVSGAGDPWFGPISTWEWVMGVNFWGVVYGCRTFLPHLAGGGHIVNTASVAGLFPGFAPPYDASKHAVVAMTESLYHAMQMAGLPIGVSVLCPGWVNTKILDSERNYPSELGPPPELDAGAEVMRGHVRRALAEGAQPAAVADAVLDAIGEDRYWVIPHQSFLDIAIDRWGTIAERIDPVPVEQTPGMPPREQIVAEVMAAMGIAGPES
ncbi:MAG: SDR family NAD(P)-dependent oxidoreductase [Desertimonas sp.]